MLKPKNIKEYMSSLQNLVAQREIRTEVEPLVIRSRKCDHKLSRLLIGSIKGHTKLL
jgi:hypothetical protein